MTEVDSFLNTIISLTTSRPDDLSNWVVATMNAVEEKEMHRIGKTSINRKFALPSKKDACLLINRLEASL